MVDSKHRDGHVKFTIVNVHFARTWAVLSILTVDGKYSLAATRLIEQFFKTPFPPNFNVEKVFGGSQPLDLFFPFAPTPTITHQHYMLGGQGGKCKQLENFFHLRYKPSFINGTTVYGDLLQRDAGI